MLTYFLKYWVIGSILAFLVVYSALWEISLIPESLLKVIVPILAVSFLGWLAYILIEIFKAEYEDYKREKPFNDAMKEYHRSVMRDEWTKFKLAWKNRKNRQ